MCHLLPCGRDLVAQVDILPQVDSYGKNDMPISLLQSLQAKRLLRVVGCKQIVEDTAKQNHPGYKADQNNNLQKLPVDSTH
jgi:hypothetical protein